MRNFTRTFRVFCIFLALCFILVSISNAKGKGQNKGYWMDVVISPIDFPCAVPELQKAVLEVDTTADCGSNGAFITYASKSLYINTLGQCFYLPDPLFEGSGITVQYVEVGCKRDRHTGEIVEVQFWLKDTEQKYYRTEIVELAIPVLPDPFGFSIPLNHCFEVKLQSGKGKKKTLGYLTVGTIEFWQK